MLDGGLPAWRAQGLDLDEQEVSESEAHKAGKAAAKPPGAGSSYQATLQVSFCCQVMSGQVLLSGVRWSGVEGQPLLSGGGWLHPVPCAARSSCAERHSPAACI